MFKEPLDCRGDAWRCFSSRAAPWMHGREWAKAARGAGLAYVLVRKTAGLVLSRRTSPMRNVQVLLQQPVPTRGFIFFAAGEAKRARALGAAVLRSATMPYLIRTAKWLFCMVRLSSSLPRRPPSREMSRWGTQHELPCTTPLTKFLNAPSTKDPGSLAYA